MELERRRVVAAVFVAAAPAEWVSLREIASFAGWPESSTSAVLTGLERHGWVASRQAESQRADWRRCWRGLREYRLTGQGVPGVRALVDTAGAA